MRAADAVEPPAPTEAVWPGAGSSPLTASIAAAPGRPLELAASGAGRVTPVGSGAIGGRGYEHGLVPDPASAALRMHGRVFFRTAAGGDASCSGTAIRSNRANLVLTAGHCVHGGGHSGDWAGRLVFVPAYADGSAPFGAWHATRLYSTPIWAEFGDPTGDVGFATVRPNRNGDLQGAVGARGIAFGADADRRYTAFGYPANPDDGFDGRRERFCRSRFSGLDPASKRGIGPRTISMRCDMTQGASGGGWISNKGIAGSLISYGYRDQPNRIFGPYLGSLARQLYEATQARCGGKVATVVGTGSGERLEGTRGRDVIAAGPSADVVTASAGRDLVCGGPGADRLAGDAGGDRLLGGGGNDRLDGATGNDLCAGGAGRDRVSGCEVRRQIP